MCGIAGLFDLTRGQPAGALEHAARVMTDTLAHRGPDGSGVFADEIGGVALGHRRLAILDLTETGAQPMASADGRFVITFNGEIYNFADIARELPGFGTARRGQSDTEVLVEACARFGVDATVRRAVGMFAFALWDRRERVLTLVRDRLGIKPLYWARAGRIILFGSEVKAILAHPAFRPELDRDALAAYMRLGYVPAPHGIYRNLHKLRPGHVMRLGLDGAITEQAFWSLRDIATGGIRTRSPLTADEATNALEERLTEAVRLRLVSDVPLGAFLSGGVDSSTVVALMQKSASGPVRTFTIGFGEADFDEADHARAVANHLGTQHTELRVTADDARAVIPMLPDMYDEPFADASAIPTFLLSRLTRGHVTVALSGDGGDELFAGYDRYRVAGMARLAFLPPAARRALGRGLGALPPDTWDTLARCLPASRRPPAVGDKLAKLARVLRARDDDDVYRAVIALWETPEDLVPGALPAPDAASDPALARDLPDFLARMQYLDSVTYLPDDILTKVDRASMAVSLEARVPLLDHRVVELAWHLPPGLKRRNGVPKWLLRQVLYRHVPRTLIERPKMGFGVPIGAWLRGPLRDWAETLLAPERLSREGVLNPGLVTRRWQEHLSERRNWSYQLWTVLMFQAWRERWLR
jgi:asparagine synthase (glutamine-hydrolysing)